MSFFVGNKPPIINEATWKNQHAVAVANAQINDKLFETIGYDKLDCKLISNDGFAYTITKQRDEDSTFNVKGHRRFEISKESANKRAAEWARQAEKDVHEAKINLLLNSAIKDKADDDRFSQSLSDYKEFQESKKEILRKYKIVTLSNYDKIYDAHDPRQIAVHSLRAQAQNNGIYAMTDTDLPRIKFRSFRDSIDFSKQLESREGTRHCPTSHD